MVPAARDLGLTTLCALVVGGVLLGSSLGPAAAAAQVGDRAPSGETLYRCACAHCHGADGRGASRSLVTFEEPLPDFTDCSFATREPDADWIAVSHQGGPARGFPP